LTRPRASSHSYGYENNDQRIDRTKVIGLRMGQVIDERVEGKHNGKPDSDGTIETECATKAQKRQYRQGRRDEDVRRIEGFIRKVGARQAPVTGPYI